MSLRKKKAVKRRQSFVADTSSKRNKLLDSSSAEVEKDPEEQRGLTTANSQDISSRSEIIHHHDSNVGKGSDVIPTGEILDLINITPRGSKGRIVDQNWVCFGAVRLNSFMLKIEIFSAY